MPAPPFDIDKVLEKFKVWNEAVQKQRQREKDDLAFLDVEHQWPKSVAQAKGPQTVNGVTIPAEPMLVIPTMDEPIQLVLNQEKAAHLGVNIHPLSEDADDDTAEIIQGLYRGIERDSHAGNARSWAYDRATKAGRGAYRILKALDPEGGHPFDQKILIRRLLFQDAATFDPFAQEPDAADGEGLFITSDVRPSTFKRRWPHARMADYDDKELVAVQTDQEDWIGGESEESRTIRVAEYFRVEITTRTFVLLDDGSVADETKIPPGRVKVTGDDARAVEQETRTVWWSTINCEEELDAAQGWDGQYLPCIPVIGREVQPFDGERRYIGMVHNAKDGARLVNYAASGAVKMASLEPQAPWQGVEGVFEGHEREYLESNSRARLLQHKPTDLMGNPAPAPQRVQVDVSRLGPSMQLLTMGRDFVQTAMSTYDPALGKQPTAHRSGRALEALQGQTVEATSNYLSNLADISMAYEARVILDLIPKLYDRPGRVARILDEHGKSSQVMLNAPFQPGPNGRPQPLPYDTPEQQAATNALVQDPKHPAKHYDLSKGRYGVSVTIGKSSSSRLQQGADEMGQIMQAEPALVPIIGPEYFRFRDFPGAQTIAKLLRKMRDHDLPWLADDPQQQQQDPAQLAAENQMLKQQLQQAGLMIETKQIEQQGKLETVKLQEGAETLRNRENNETKLAVAELGAKVDRLTLFLEERARLGVQQHEASEAARSRAHDVGLAALDHAQTREQADQAHGQQLAQNEQVNDHAMDQQAQSAALAPEPAPVAE